MFWDPNRYPTRSLAVAVVAAIARAVAVEAAATLTTIIQRTMMLSMKNPNWWVGSLGG